MLSPVEVTTLDNLYFHQLNESCVSSVSGPRILTRRSIIRATMANGPPRATGGGDNFLPMVLLHSSASSYLSESVSVVSPRVIP